MKIRIKETYLLILIVLGLVSLSVYSTYALFTKEVSINNVVSFNATLANSDSKLLEYELVSLLPNETKTVELNVENSYTGSLYYGCWYELLSSNSNVSVGIYTEKSSTLATGTIESNGTKNIVIGVVNNSTTTNALVNIGVVGSVTESLGLSNSRIIITDTYTPSITVTEEYLDEHSTITNVNLEYTNPQKYTVTLTPGVYLLETWGAQGGSYSTTYTGGKGGYSYGTLTTSTNLNLYVYPGGQGTSSGTSTTGALNGGFNGGGSANGTTSYLASAGGGASDIRIGTDSLYARVIVAGGGGGSGSYNTSNHYKGGSGGGTTGGSGTMYSSNYKSGTGGSQTAYGNSYYNTTLNSTSYGTLAGFGIGASGTTGGISGGGGGFYGGGYGYRSGAGGGSGFVYTSSTYTNYPTGSLLNSVHYLTDAATIGGDSSFTDFDGATVTGHSGNGAVRISGLAINSSIPVINGLDRIDTDTETAVSLIDGVTYVCENGSNGCTYVGPNISNTSSLPVGTHTVYYRIIGSNGIEYIYSRIVVITGAGVNSPDLVNGLIPVVYNETNSAWVKADSSNENSSWYNYNDKKWANAVLVSSTNRSTYNNATAGTVIAEDDILAFYVWIPRFKYKVWNIDKTYNTDSYGAQNSGIDILFENEKTSTGAIGCSYNYNVSSGMNESCTGKNENYYTHPAFTFGSTELRGFWVGKFEISSTSSINALDDNYEDGDEDLDEYIGGLSTTLTPRILPNVSPWRGNSLSNFFKVIYDMQKSNNIYGLSTSRTNTDSHMITNMEWGAVAYLTYSKYGSMYVSRNGCYITGVSNNQSITGYCGSLSYMYKGENGLAASTTRNITGVYDMNGGADEYVMGNVSSNTSSYTYNVSSAGSNFTYSTSNTKYLTTYAYNSSQISYSIGRLGDATVEVRTPNSVDNTSTWKNGYDLMPYTSMSWFERGGNKASYANHIFSFTNAYGYEYEVSGDDYIEDSTTRAILVSVQ